VTGSIMFMVRGTPATQGNKTAFVAGGRAVMREGKSKKASEGFHAWRHGIATEARAAMAERPQFTGPLCVQLRFALPKPASAPKTKVTWPIKARSGDIDKLARAALDAMTDVVFADDSQVVRLEVTKEWSDPFPTGVAIQVRALA
jgi:crossover junction endodeoxyribonuclease RusA